MSKKRWHGGRGLLNLQGFETTGAIVAEIEDTRNWKSGRDGEGNKIGSYISPPSTTIAISDCSRSVQLSTYFTTKEEYENLLFKVDVMIDALQGFRDGLEIEYPLFQARQKIALANEMKEKKNEENTLSS